MDTNTSEQAPRGMPPDPMVWARAPRVYCDRARELAPLMGLDAEKLVLGEALYRITGDDANIFQGLASDKYNYAAAEERLAERLDWETSVLGENPQIIEELEQLRQKMGGLEWSDSSQREQIYSNWSNFSDSVSRIIDERPDLADAVSYASEKKQTIKDKIKSQNS